MSWQTELRELRNGLWEAFRASDTADWMSNSGQSLAGRGQQRRREIEAWKEIPNQDTKNIERLARYGRAEALAQERVGEWLHKLATAKEAER